MALLMSSVALSIDAILPALSVIGDAVHSPSSTDNQLFINMIFMGIGIGQLVYGPLSDSFGRKPMIYIGMAIFSLASLICINAQSFDLMIVGRLLQGLGLAAGRTICTSIIRDSYKGDRMAKIMSFVMVIFILVPILAPMLGKWILDVFDWKAIFYFQLIFTVIVTTWFGIRQPETLHPNHKKPFRPSLFIQGIRELIRHKESVIFTLIAAFVSGSFLTYLSSTEQIFAIQYGMPDEFPYIFAALAFTFGIATFLNGQLVMKLGMRNLVLIALIGFCMNAGIYTILFWDSHNPAISIFMIFIAIQFIFLGFIFGNTNAIAMESIGHIAGIGAAIIGFISMFLAVPIATFMGKFVENTALPIFVGFTFFGVLSLGLFFLAKKYVQ